MKNLPIPSGFGRWYLEPVLLSSLLRNFIDFFVFMKPNNYHKHLRFCSDKAVNHTDSIIFQLDLKQTGKVNTTLIAERLAVTAFALRKGILTYLFDRFHYTKDLLP